MRVIRILAYVVLIPVGAFLLFLLWATLDDYRPDQVEEVSISEETELLSDSAQLDLLIWNIGYAGLDASMDFFYDGGAQMRPSEDGVKENLEGIRATLGKLGEFDFVLLQEVDRDSKRSYHEDQHQTLKELFPDYHMSFGKNYEVSFVPIPLKEPMGKVRSGLMTYSRPVPSRVDRHSFPGNYSWPMKLFMLDRCFLVNRYPVSNGRELLVVNTHNSAYDDGSLRAEQMEFLKDFLLEEYGKGNYLVVGGDWNQSPYGFEPRLPSHVFDTINLTYIEKDYPDPDWQWAFDPEIPTNRRVAVPYDRASSLTTVIDYFLLSPNIQVREVKTHDVDFRFSDHQPVQVSIHLLP